MLGELRISRMVCGSNTQYAGGQESGCFSVRSYAPMNSGRCLTKSFEVVKTQDELDLEESEREVEEYLKACSTMGGE